MSEEEERKDSKVSEEKKPDLELRHSWTFYLECYGEKDEGRREFLPVNTARGFWSVFKPLEAFLEPMYTENKIDAVKITAPMKCNIFFVHSGEFPPLDSYSYYSFRVVRAEKKNGAREIAKLTENARNAVTTVLINTISGNDIFEIVEGIKIRIRPSIIGIDIFFSDNKTCKVLRAFLNDLIANNHITCDKEVGRYPPANSAAQKKEGKGRGAVPGASPAPASPTPSSSASSSNPAPSSTSSSSSTAKS